MLSKADHLQKAAEHLEAAGLEEEAQRVRQIAAKEASHAATASFRPILVDFCMLELSQTKLGKLSSGRYGGSKEMSVMELVSKLQSAQADSKIPALPPSSGSKLVSLIEALRKDHLVDVLAQPALMVNSDEPACIKVGGALGYQVKDAEGKEVTKFLEYGMRADVSAHLVSSERIHLDFRLRKSELDVAHSVQVGGRKIPALNTREVETGLDLRPGQTIALGGARVRRAHVAAPAAVAGDKRDASGARGEADAVVETFQLFVLVKAELVTKGMLESAAAKPVIPR